jgi:hypothetical protein
MKFSGIMLSISSAIFRAGREAKMPPVKAKSSLLITAVVLIGVGAVDGGSKVPPELIGTWSYTSMTALKNGKPFGTTNFQPGQWTVTFNQDATWVMKTLANLNPHGLSGTYEVHGHDVDMKLANGKPYYKYHLTIEQDGKVLVLTDKGSINRATRE